VVLNTELTVDVEMVGEREQKGSILIPFGDKPEFREREICLLS
jgi:hypothetical protein